MRIAGQLRQEAGPCPDHIYLILEVRRPPQPHMHIKAPWRSKGELCQGMSVCLVKSILAKGMHANTWGDLEIHQMWTVNQGDQNDWPKETQKKCPMKVIQTATRAQL